MTDPQLVVLATPGTSVGFALAGVPTVEIADRANTLAEVTRLIDGAEAEVVIIEESLYQDLAPDVRRGFGRLTQPVIIPVPGPSWSEESNAHEYIVDILRRAIGYRVRLQ
jgi:vacuolar-type H+-ATPase subunit F/Vma7